MTLLDRFNVLEFLGEGAWGRVYLMHDALFSQALAVKVVEVTDADEGAVGRVLLHEARAADRIQDHRHVVKRFGTHHVELDERDLLLLPMEYADGGDLRTWLTQHRDGPDRRREKGFEYFVQLCHGVAAVNEAGLVCGDIKPENVLLVGGVVKLGDLGTAITLDESVGEAASSLPIPLESIGTPAYMSPEMFTAAHWSEIDARSDVYSLGVILYEILHPAGERPFDGDWDSLRELHVNAPSPSLPGVEPALSEIVARCLAKSPEERFETSSDLLAALEAFAPQVSGPQQGQAGSEDWEVLDTLWEYTSEAIEQREFNEARNMCRQILSSFPEHVSTRLALEELDDRFQRAEYMYRDIYQHMGVRNLAESVALAAQAVEMYADHPAGRMVQPQLEARIQQYAELVEEGYGAIGGRGLGYGLQCLREAVKLNPGEMGVAHAVAMLEHFLQFRRDTHKRIHAALEQGQFEAAMELGASLDDEKARFEGFFLGGRRAAAP